MQRYRGLRKSPCQSSIYSTCYYGACLNMIQFDDLQVANVQVFENHTASALRFLLSIICLTFGLGRWWQTGYLCGVRKHTRSCGQYTFAELRPLLKIQVPSQQFQVTTPIWNITLFRLLPFCPLCRETVNYASLSVNLQSTVRAITVLVWIWFSFTIFKLLTFRCFRITLFLRFIFCVNYQPEFPLAPMMTDK